MAGSITNHGHRSAEYVGGWDEAVKMAVDELQEGDLLLTLGAGDVWKAGEQILEGLGK